MKRSLLPALNGVLALHIHKLHMAQSFKAAISRMNNGHKRTGLFKSRTFSGRRLLASAQAGQSDEVQLLKQDLQEYLKVREQDCQMQGQQSSVKKKIGGTRGNALLQYVSAPVPKEEEIEAKQPFDYDELTKYGYGRLVKQIMNLGGRAEAYKLMDMEPPPLPNRLKPKKRREIVIDRDGSLNQSGYKGLRLGNLDESIVKDFESKNLDDPTQRVHASSQEYVLPFSDVQSTGVTADWTPEMIDREARRRGRSLALLKAEESSKLSVDREETLFLDGPSLFFSSSTSLLAAFAFGRASEKGFQLVGVNNLDIQHAIQACALVLLLSACMSSLASAIFATQKNRNAPTWALKGFLGGPFSLLKLTNLDALPKS